jgi:hypothetical protein
MIKRLFSVFIFTLLLTFAAAAGPEFRVAGGLLMLFDGGKTTPIRYNTQTDLNFAEGGSVRVFSTVTPEGTADVEVLARSQVDFYFLGADVSLASSGTVRAAVENLRHPEIKVSWDGGTASASKIVQTAEELLSYFIVSQPPVFSHSPISDDDLAKIFPSQSAGATASPTPESNDAVEVDFPLDSTSAPNAGRKSQAKPTSSPKAAFSPTPGATVSPTPRRTQSDRALLAALGQATPGQSRAATLPGPQPTPLPTTDPLLEAGPELPVPSPTPTLNTPLLSPRASATPGAVADTSPSPELMPDLPLSASEAATPAPLGKPSPVPLLTDANTGTSQENRAPRITANGKKPPGEKPQKEPGPLLKSLVASAGPSAIPDAAKASKHKSLFTQALANHLARRTGQVAKTPVEPLNLAGVGTPTAMPRMPALLETNSGPQFLPIIKLEPPSREASTQNKEELPTEQQKENGPASRPIEPPDIVIGVQEKPKEVRKALPVDEGPNDVPLEAEKPPQNVPPLVVIDRQLTTEQQPQSLPPLCVISSIKKTFPPQQDR